MEFFKKYKKSIGVVMVLVIVIISSLFLYQKNGIYELSKNNNEDIFVDEIKENDDSKSEVEAVNTKETQVVNTKNKKITVEIKGEVKKPDVYTLEEGSIVRDIIDIAGGVTEKADLSSINRAKQLQNHELVYISNKDEINTTQNKSAVNQSATNSSAAISNSNGLININFATIEELKQLNGIGDSKAKSIIEYREENGSFNSIEDIKNVNGIGEKMFEKIKEQITI